MRCGSNLNKCLYSAVRTPKVQSGRYELSPSSKPSLLAGELEQAEKDRKLEVQRLETKLEQCAGQLEESREARRALQTQVRSRGAPSNLRQCVLQRPAASTTACDGPAGADTRY